MNQARYFIVKIEENWVIRYGEEEFGPYTSQSEALMFAVDAARQMGASGAHAEVCLMGENGHFRPEWTSATADQNDALRRAQ